MEPSHQVDLAELKVEINKTDKATQDFLKPIVNVPVVQSVLSSFMCDKTRSFSEWVWLPQNYQILDNVRSQFSANATDWNKLEEKFQSVMLDDQVSFSDTLNQVEKMKEEGRTKFVAGNYFAAMRSYENAIALLQEYKSVFEEKEMELYVTCCCNAAVAAMKEERWSTVREYSTEAISVNPKCSKAYYLRSKFNLKEGMMELAMRDISRGLDLQPAHRDLLNLKALIGKLNTKIPEPIVPPKMDGKSKIGEDKERRRIRLPPLDALGKEIAELNQYIAQSHLNIYPVVHETEESSFCCIYYNEDNKIACGEGQSKKKAQKNAAVLVIQQLHEMYPEDADLPVVVAKKDSNDDEDMLCNKVPRMEWKGLGDKIQRPRKEKLINSVMLLGILHSQKILMTLEFDFEDKSTMKDYEIETLFICRITINSMQMAEASGKSKKFAKNKASEIAVEKIVKFVEDIE